MPNIKIGHITLPVDADSISFVDIKNNMSSPAIRGGVPQAIPIGSSNVGIRINTIFPSVDDVNIHLRELISLMKGMPFINIQSDLLSSCYLLGLRDERIKSQFLERAAELAKDYLSLQDNQAKDISELLIDVIVKDLFHPSFVSVATNAICVKALNDFFKGSNYDYVNKILSRTKNEPRAGADTILADIINLYRIAVSTFANEKGRKRVLDANKEVTEAGLVSKFIQLANGGEGEFARDVVDAARSPLISTQNLTFPTDVSKVLDGDDLELIPLKGTSFVMGIASYQETAARGSQAFYQRDLFSYNDSYAARAGAFWDNNWTSVIAKTYFSTNDGNSIVDLIAGVDTPITTPVGGTVLAGESGGLHLVKQGYAFPRAIQNLGLAGPKDLPYINAASAAAEAGTGVWNPAIAVSDYFNAGHKLTIRSTFDKTEVQPSDSTSRKVFLPQDFNNFEASMLVLYRVPHSTIKTTTPTIIDLTKDVVQFNMKMTNGPELIDVRIRALNIKQLNVSFMDFINSYYYFMTLGRQTKSLTSFSEITSFNGTPIDSYTNPNPYYLNAIIGPEDLEDINGNLSDNSFIHFFLPLSEVPIKETAVSSTLTYLNTSLAQVPLTEGTLHINSKLVTGVTRTIKDIKATLELAATNLVAGVPQTVMDATRGARVTRIFQGVQSKIDGAQVASGVEAVKSASDSANLGVVKFLDDWIPVAFQNISLSTVPNLPESISVSFNFIPFNFTPYTPTFGYIPTILKSNGSGDGIVAGDRRGDGYELDLALSPIITRWLDKAFLSATSGNDYIGYYSIPEPTKQVLALQMTYPKILFSDVGGIEQQKTIRVASTALINFFSTTKKKEEDSSFNGTENIYNIIMTSISVVGGNNFAVIPMQSAEHPTMQHIGKRGTGIAIQLITDSLEAIATLRKVDALFQKVARSTYHEEVPVKIKILHPLVQMLGNNNYIPRDITIASDSKKPGWYTINLTYMQTGDSAVEEELELVDRPRSFSGDTATEKNVIDTLVEDIARGTQEGQRLWSHLIGPILNAPASYEARLFEIPALLMYLDRNKDNRYDVYLNLWDNIWGGSEVSELQNVTGSQILNKISNRSKNTSVAIKAFGLYPSPNSPKPELLNLFDELIKANTDENSRASFTSMRSTVNDLIALMNMSPIIKTVYAGSPPFLQLFKYTNILDYKIINESGKINSIRSVPGINYFLDTESYKEVMLDDVTGAVGFGVIDFDNNKQIGATASLGGVYDEPDSRDLFFAGRLALYRSPSYAVGNPEGFVTFKNVSQTNILAYTVANLSTVLFKALEIYRASNSDLNGPRQFIRRILIDAMKYESFKKGLEAMIASLAERSDKYAEIYSAIPKFQSSYPDLKLPTYNELYGIFGNNATEAPKIRESLIKLSSITQTSAVPSVLNKLSSMERNYGYLSDGVLTDKISGENRSDILNNLRLDIQFIESELLKISPSVSPVRKDVVDKIKLEAPPVIEKLYGMIDSMFGENGKATGSPSLYTELKNLPTYRELGIKPPLNNFGELDMGAPGRAGGDFVEPGWQYFTPFIEKEVYGTSTLSSGPATVEGALNNKGMKKQEDSHFSRNTNASTISGEKETRSIHKPVGSTKKEIDSLAEKAEGGLSKLSNKHIEDNISKDNLKQIVQTAVDKEIFNSKEKNADGSLKGAKPNRAGSDYHTNGSIANVDPKTNPYQSGYITRQHRWQQLYKSSLIFNMRKAFPVVHLYFLQEAGTAFERWTRFYKYDSIIEISVTDGKEEVAGAKVTLTNFGGYLTNEYREENSPYANRDIIKNEETTILKTDDDSWVVGQDGRLIQGNRDSLRSRGRILAFDLRPGTRIQIRMGYSSVDAENEIIFTGKIAEVFPGKIIEFIAQSHDYELMRNLNDKWEGSYNSFPSIISDMMHYTENFGGWEPYKFDARVQNDVIKKQEAQTISLGEKVLGYNDTSNDNLYGLQDDRIYTNAPWRFWVVLDGKEWYCNGPALENIFSMRRYIPNFVVNVRPYDERSTLYFGPKEGAYVYTSKMTPDLARYNKVIKDKHLNQNLLDVFYSPTTSHVPRKGTTEFDHYINGTGDDICKTVLGISIDYSVNSIYERMLEAIGNITNINDIDLARLFLRWWARGASKYSFGDDNTSLNYGFEFAEIGINGNVPRNESSQEIQKKAAEIGTRMQRQADQTSNLFIKIYSENVNNSFGQAVGDVVNGPNPSTLSAYRPIVSVDYTAFRREILNYGTEQNLIEALDFNIRKIKDDNGKAKIVEDPASAIDFKRDFITIGQDLKKHLGNILSLIIGSGNSITAFSSLTLVIKNTQDIQSYIVSNKDLDRPILYYAVTDPARDNKITWTGYVSLKSLLLYISTPVTDNSRFNSILIYSLFRDLPTMILKTNKNLDSRASKIGENISALRRNFTDFPPNKRPFKLNHTILDTQIVSNNIIATKAMMANKVVMWYPKEGNASYNEGAIEGGGLIRQEISYAPVLSDELVASVFERNAAEADIFDTKATQVSFGFLGDKLREMYQGDLVILGDEKIKPFDQIYINDSLKGMHGTFEVDKVTHIFDAEKGFLTIIKPHLIVYVNEDTEARAAFLQCLMETAGTVGPAFIAFAFLANVGIPVMLVGGLFLGVFYSKASDSSSQRGVPSDSILGIPLTWPTTVGYTSSWGGHGGYSVRRNPCRLEPLMYRGTPLVAGLDNWEKRNWTNRQAEDIIKREISLGKQTVGKNIKGWFTSIGESIDELFINVNSGRRALNTEINKDE